MVTFVLKRKMQMFWQLMSIEVKMSFINKLIHIEENVIKLCFSYNRLTNIIYVLYYSR